MVRKNGATSAKRFGDRCEKNMDQHNNARGRKLASESPGQSCDVLCVSDDDLQRKPVPDDSCEPCDSNYDTNYYP